MNTESGIRFAYLLLASIRSFEESAGRHLMYIVHNFFNDRWWCFVFCGQIKWVHFNIYYNLLTCQRWKEGKWCDMENIASHSAEIHQWHSQFPSVDWFALPHWMECVWLSAIEKAKMLQCFHGTEIASKRERKWNETTSKLIWFILPNRFIFSSFSKFVFSSSMETTNEQPQSRIIFWETQARTNNSFCPRIGK